MVKLLCKVTGRGIWLKELEEGPGLDGSRPPGPLGFEQGGVTSDCCFEKNAGPV